MRQTAYVKLIFGAILSCYLCVVLLGICKDYLWLLFLLI